MAWNIQLWDRVRAALRAANVFRIDNIYQDQDDLSRVVSGGNFADLSKQSALLEQTNLQINRLERYKDYDMMDEVGEVTLALDMYADEASLTDPERKHSVIVKAQNLRVKRVIEDLLYNTLLIDSQIRPITRYLCKYGDFPAEIVPTKNRDGVASFRFINVYNFTRIQTKFGDLVGFYYQDPASAGPQFLHPWQVMHMRLTTFETVYTPYGRCAIQGTMVQTPQGEIPIENLRPQDEVYCFDGYNRIKTRVIDLVNNGMKMTYSLHTANRRLNLTNNHPVMLLNRHNMEVFYRPVHQVQEGDLLLAPQPDGAVEVEGISRIEKRDRRQVFDIGVESSNHNFMANGAVVHNSILDGGRKDFKRLRLMEDAALVYRITRAPEKRVFSIPVGNIPTKDVPQYIELIARGFKKAKFVDPATGSVNERYNPLIQDDDFFLPKRPDGTGPTVDTLPGAENLDAIADIEYFKKKMVAGLKIPFSRVGIGDPAEPNGKSLSSTSPEFAKNIQWIQREVITQLKKMVIVHLALRGHSMEEIRNFDLYMTAASAIDELYRIEVWNTRTDIISNLKETGLFPDEWILVRFTDMSRDEIRQMQLEKETKNDIDRMRAESSSQTQDKLITEYEDFLDRIYNMPKEQKVEEYSNVSYLVNQKELDGLKGTDGKCIVESSIPSKEANEVKDELKSMLEGASPVGGDQMINAIAAAVEDEQQQKSKQNVLAEDVATVVDGMDDDQEQQLEDQENASEED